MLTGGQVSVEDGIKKPEEYAPPRKVRVEIHFAVPDGSDEGQRILDDAGRIADNKVNELLGRKPAAVVDTAARDAAKAAYAEKANAADAAGKSAKPPKQPKTPKQTDIEDELNAPTAVVGNELDDVLGGGATPEPITDAKLLDAVKSVHTSPLMAPRIKEVVFAFCPREDKAGFRVSDIAQEHRARFIERIKALPQN